jgi:aminoglycoside phosphotransferase (APT) family kinase protein
MPTYTDLCAGLAPGDIESTIQHDDLHDGNVFVGEAGDRIFDWGDAAVAHPFGTLLATLRSIASRTGDGAEPAVQARLRDAYLEPWTDRHSRVDLAAHVAAALRVATVGRALAWQRALSGVPPHQHGEYAGAVRDWILELFEPNLTS